MRYSLSIFLLAILFIFSCSDDDAMNDIDDTMEEEMEEEMDERLINDFIWERLADSTSAIENLPVLNWTYHTILFEDLVIYFHSRLKGFIAVDAETGDEVWNNYGDLDISFIPYEPIVHNGLLYFVDNPRQNLYVMDAREKSEVFRYEMFSGFFANEPVIFDDTLYLAVQYDEGDNFTEWTAIPLDGVDNVNEINVYDWSQILDDETNYESGTKPVFYNNEQGEKIMVFPTSNSEAYVSAYNLEQEVFEWRYSSTSLSSSRGVFLVSDDEHVYLSRNSALTCLDINTGNIVWQNESVFINELSSGLYRHNNSLIALGSEAYSFDTANGNLAWQVNNYDTGPLSGNVPIASSNVTAKIYQDHIYFFTERFTTSHMLKMEIVTGDVEFFFLDRLREVEGVDVPVGPIDFNNSYMQISDDGILYSNDQYRLWAIELP